ncbi:hypothetical protein GALMADRAFT_260379 [Galerina marginata CBS 339.88]|uniref:Uncharacterized protein n=1 Tax=Galerina marginata (strain CBS 339.88) TaxID=685588 RepID=A0A067SE27_GALM3|nr:hypothetical protein GALMADRAFT_260379 [Galerina marginata CBS 339.88]
MWTDIRIFERFGGGQDTRIYPWCGRPTRPGTPHNNVVKVMAPHCWVKVWIRERIGRETEHKGDPMNGRAIDTHRRPALRITLASDNYTNSPTHTELFPPPPC